MSEEQPAYLTVDRHSMPWDGWIPSRNDPTASHWLKRAITELWERDTVDALNDLDVLRELLEAKHRTDLLMLERWATRHDGTKH